MGSPRATAIPADGDLLSRAEAEAIGVIAALDPGGATASHRRAQPVIIGCPDAAASAVKPSPRRTRTAARSTASARRRGRARTSLSGTVPRTTVTR